MTPAKVDRYTCRRPLQPLDDRYDRYTRLLTVWPAPDTGYGFTVLPLPPASPLLEHPPLYNGCGAVEMQADGRMRFYGFEGAAVAQIAERWVEWTRATESSYRRLYSMARRGALKLKLNVRTECQ